MEYVDILQPPTFQPSGQTKTLQQAWNDQDWIGTFNLWIVQSTPVPSIIYQQRSPQSIWAPLKLDVTAGGHYETGESISDGLREVREELGKNYDFNQLINIGRKIHVGLDINHKERRNLVDIFMVIDNSELSTYTLERSEVYAIVTCPLNELIKVHQHQYSFVAHGLDVNRQPIQITVNQDSFPYNWDNYHYKIVLLADRLVKGDQNLIY